MVNSVALRRHQDLGDGGTGPADDGLDRGDVGLAERAVLREDQNLLALASPMNDFAVSTSW